MCTYQYILLALARSVERKKKKKEQTGQHAILYIVNGYAGKGKNGKPMGSPMIRNIKEYSTSFKVLYQNLARAVGRSENPGVSVVIRWA